MTNQIHKTAKVAGGLTGEMNSVTTQGGIKVIVKWRFGDYLNRSFTSWRTKGLAIGIFTMTTIICVFQKVPPDAFNSALKSYLIMNAIFLPMLLTIFVGIAGYYWLIDQRRQKQEVWVFSNEGIQSISEAGSGQLMWSAFVYYKENRWSFFVWNPRGSLWQMIPKHSFASKSELELCRQILRSHLKPSRWFFY